MYIVNNKESKEKKENNTLTNKESKMEEKKQTSNVRNALPIIQKSERTPPREKLRNGKRNGTTRIPPTKKSISSIRTPTVIREIPQKRKRKNIPFGKLASTSIFTTRDFSF